MLFALSTGLRVGELLGLRWSDVHLEENIIHIRRQLAYLDFGEGYKFYVQGLKTQAGRRDIPLTMNARKSLKEQKELDLILDKEARRKEVEGISDYIFTKSQGKPHTTGAINRMLNDVVKEYNRQAEMQDREEGGGTEYLPHISAHTLRHTACSRMAESGLDPKVLQYVMGHSSISITMDIYTHLDFSQIQKKMCAIEEEVKME